MTMQEHPLRRALSNELHTRPFFGYDGTGRLIRYMFLFEGNDSSILAHVNSWLERCSVTIIENSEKFRREVLEHFILRIERHTEFVTITFIVNDNTGNMGLPVFAFNKDAASFLPFDMIDTMPVPVFHAIWLEVADFEGDSITSDAICELLAVDNSGSSQIYEGAGQVHFSFDIDNTGFSRIILLKNCLNPDRVGRSILRLLELETYRILTLFGLPNVRSQMSELSALEKELQELIQNLSRQIDIESNDVDALLPRLSKIAARVEEMSAVTSYRLSATKAYQEIFLARVSGLNMSRLDGFQSIPGFLNRRMLPAMQTCIAFGERLNSVSERVARAGSLLRAQTETMIQNQNTALLASMDKRASTQLRLQQTVEGLSVIAGTYYGVRLVEYIATTIPSQYLPLAITQIKALSVPIVAFIIYTIIHQATRTKHRSVFKK